jgi:hypothetical protein
MRYDQFVLINERAASRCLPERQEKTVERPVRRHLRFPPDEGAVAWIDPRPHTERKDFKPTVAALVTDEALAGCGLVILSRDRLSEGAELMVRVTDLVPLRAQVRWVRDLGDGVVKLGVEFLE